MPRCLITGATGFIGARATGDMQRNGWTIHTLVRDLARSPTASAVHSYDGSMVSMRKALCAANPEVVIHLATCYLKDHLPEQIPELISSNIIFGTQLLEAMGEVDCDCLVTTGTAWQHLDVADDGYRPATLYAATKQAFEDIARWYVEARKMNVIALHLGDTFGPGDPRPKIFNILADAYRAGCAVELSPGGQYLDPLFIVDAVSALEVAARRLLAHEGSGYELFRVSPGLPITLREMVECWCSAYNSWPELKWGAKPYRQREVMNPWLGGQLLPGWKAKIGLREGLGQCVLAEKSQERK